jgi:hypothetical protein
MASAVYKDCLLVWKARRNTASGQWIPEARITWKVGGHFQEHFIKGPPQHSEQKALFLAQELAEKWVDKEM